MLVYQKTQEFFASHFNESAYAKYESVMSICESASIAIPKEFLHGLLIDIHGHNFKATVRVDGKLGKDSRSAYLISDEVITDTVNEWHGINLSVHSDFLNSGKRATTENMADVLAHKIGSKLLVSALVIVTIHETDYIFATYSKQFTVIKSH